ncbi:hypothetical protein [Noviherbaspirillum suwonense]|jgi:hypothetical protein|uniref:Uncharacterized protein n=1 Tax=Noviherbaspirillum suwonense TaxID=1224511 RepID=A0ABY1QBX0_9BURK|nr:hypothetical protein [Noviherbaspirillum suwonense]SMP63778.1 hypothetical protein SAMN06295970_109140 [Noviherbaspirillum suwonense]
MAVELPAKLYTAVGTFQCGQDLRIDVAVPNFPTEQEAEDYAQAFGVKLADGLLFRNDGKAGGLFDEDPREVLDSQVAISRRSQDGGAESYRPESITIAQLAAAPGFDGAFQPVAWRVEEDRI